MHIPSKHGFLFSSLETRLEKEKKSHNEGQFKDTFNFTTHLMGTAKVA
jgi:hypothetical protein